MNTFKVCFAIVLTALVAAEPPSGYSYSRPSGGVGGGYSGGSLSGGWPGSNSGRYAPVSTGHQTSEGIDVDPQLLEQVRQILLEEEKAAGWQSNNAGWQSSPSSSYGVPLSKSSGRVIGLDIEGIRQAIQVAQYKQKSQGLIGGGNNGWTSGPSNAYDAQSGQSNSYDAQSGQSNSYSSQSGPSSSYLSHSGPSTSFAAPNGPATSYSSFSGPSSSHGAPSEQWSSYDVSSSYGY